MAKKISYEPEDIARRLKLTREQDFHFLKGICLMILGSQPPRFNGLMIVTPPAGIQLDIKEFPKQIKSGDRKIVFQALRQYVKGLGEKEKALKKSLQVPRRKRRKKKKT